MRAPLGSRGAHLGDFGVGLGAALGGRPRRARIDMRGRGRWPSAGATLDLDFVTQQGYAYGQGIGRIQDLVTISGGAGGTVVGPSGLIVSASAPRFDYDAVSLACKGLLIEEQRTNIAPYSDNGLGWVANGTTPPTVTNGVTYLGETCAKLDFDSTMGLGYSNCSALRNTAGYNFGVTNGVTYTHASYLSLSRALTGSERLKVYITGAAGIAEVELTSANSADYVGRFKRFTGTGAATVTGNDYFTVLISGALDSPVSLYATKLGAEAGSFATSHTPTTSAAVTRTVDRLSIAGANFRSLYGPHTAGTLLAEFTALSYAGGVSRGVASLTNGLSTWNGFYQAGLSSIDVSIYDGSVVQADALFAGQTAGVPSKVAAAFAPNDWIAALNGALSAADQAVTLFAPDRLLIGTLIDSGAYPFCGHIRRLRYWPRRLSNTELQELTR